MSSQTLGRGQPWFDKYAPMGPMLVSPGVLGAAGGLRLRTWVNNELRQDSDTSDLLFGVEDIIAFISQGTTLHLGTVIMTGTPAGVGALQPNDQLTLKLITQSGKYDWNTFVRP